MLTTTVIFAFSLFISNTYAECPQNPKQRAKECGDIFAQFAQKADESTDALLRHCPEVYEALDCLRDIFNDCEMYQKLGLKMTDKQYDQMKKPLDNICNTIMSPDSEGPNELPDSAASDEFSDLNTSQTDELQNSNETDTEESASIPSPQCAQELMACNEMGKGISAGLPFTEICNKMREMAICLDELKEGECASSLLPGAAENLGMARKQFNQICSGQTPTATKNKRRVSNMQETLCVMDAESCSDHLHSFSLSQNVCGSVKQYLDCYRRLNRCHGLLPSLYTNKYQSTQTKYNQVCTGQKCADATRQCYSLKENLDHDRPASTRCPKVVEIVRCAFKQYSCGSPYDIFFGDFVVQVNNMLGRCNYQNMPAKRNIPSDFELKRDVPGLSEEDEQRCSDSVYECIRQAIKLRPRENLCVAMGRFISCIETVSERCADFAPEGVSLAEKLNKARNDHNKVCGHRKNGKRSVSTRSLDNFSGHRKNGKRSVSTRSLDNFSGHRKNGKRSVSTRSLDNFRCVIYFKRCENNYGQKAFDKIHEITDCHVLEQNIRCNDEGIDLCRDILPDYDGAKKKIADARAMYNGRCGTTEEVEESSVSTKDISSECTAMSQECVAMVGRFKFSGDLSALCGDLREMISCMENVVDYCSSVLPNIYTLRGRLARSKSQVRALCRMQLPGGNLPTPTGQQAECVNLVQSCTSQFSSIDYNNGLEETCNGLRSIVGCFRNVLRECRRVLPNAAQIERNMDRTQNQVSNACGQRNDGKRSVSTRGLGNFRCVIYFERCEKTYGQKAFDKIHEITDCHVLEQNIRCNDEGIDLCQDIIPNYDGAKKQIAKARAMYNGRCGTTEEVEESSVSTKDMSSECTAMSQECVAMVGRFKFSGDLSVLCGDLREMISCMENVVNHCSSVLPNIATIRGQLVRSKSQVGTLCKMQLPGGTLPTPTGQEAECVNLVQSCTSQFSSIDYNNGLEETCNGLRSIVGCFRNVLKKCRRVLPNAAQIERNMDQAQKQVSNTCGSTPGTISDSMVTSSSSNGGVSLMECSNMNKKCVGYLGGLQQIQNPQAACSILNTTVDCFNVVVAKCRDTLPNIAEIDTMMVKAREQVSLACNKPEGVPDTNEDCQEMIVVCMKGMQDFSIGPNQEESCREFQNIKSCFDNVAARCGSLQGQIGMYMTGLEKQIAQICGGIDFESETAVESKPVQGGNTEMECYRELQRCSTESNIISDSDCEGIMSTVECLKNVSNDCAGVLPPMALEHMKRIETMAGNCSNTTEEIEEEEVDSAWCASKAQSCLNIISSFSVKSGMEATCSSLHTMVKCFDEVIDKCQSSIADIEKNSGQLFAMKENIESACRKGGTGLVITPNSNHEKCMSKYKKCAGLMAKVPLHEDNKIMCPSLRRSMACIKKVTLECSSLLPESAKQQFSNFENLNKICPVGSYKNSKSRSKFTEKCRNDIKVCDSKANGIMNGDNISETDCRDGFRTLTCYRQVARECRLPKSNRKFFKHFKTVLTDTCERRSTVRHTRGQIDFDIDWPWEDQDWADGFEGDNSSEDTFLFGDDDFEFEKDF